MSDAPKMTQRGHKYLQAAQALRKLSGTKPGDLDRYHVLHELLFELAVLEGQCAEGETPPRAADFRRVWTVEAIKLGVPPEIIKILGS